MGRHFSPQCAPPFFVRSLCVSAAPGMIAAMMAPRDKPRWLGYFGRSLRFLGPHKRPLILGFIAALGVGVFYTGSISSIIPALKMLFADHETLADWLHRSETEHRVGIDLAADVPDDPRGLRIVGVHPQSPNAHNLTAGDYIVAVDYQRGDSFRIAELLSQRPGQTETVSIVVADGTERDVALKLTPYRPWWGLFRDTAARLPQGRTPGDRFTTLAIVLAVIVAVSTLGSLCRFANEALVAIAVQRTMHDLRCTLARRVLNLPVPWHSARPIGDTLGRFANDLNRVEVGVTTLFGKTIREPIKAVGVLTLTILIDWRILVIALVGLPIAALLIRLFGGYVRRAQKQASRAWGVLLDHLDERLAGIRIVKAYNMQRAETQRFEHEGRALTKAQTNIEVADAATKPSLETLAILAIAGFILYGGSRVFHNQLEPHMFFGAVVCLAGMFDPVRKLGNVNNRVHAADAAAARVFEVIDTKPEEIRDDNGSRPAPPAFEHAIEFRNVSFAYPGNRGNMVLSNVSLEVGHGQVVAIVGPNGSGKTTLVSLLLRFFEPLSGEILIDGRNIAELSLHGLRALMGLVTQEAIIFSSTVRENIAYGAGDVPEDAIRRAARLAHLDEFLDDLARERDGEVGRGLDAAISAKQLSGGQRQRIAIARAILRDPPILVLDEATSQVDSESERKIQEALDDVTRGRTTFIIAHRFSTIARADRVVVLNEGKIVGVGRHDELTDACPVYDALCQTQFASQP